MKFLATALPTLPDPEAPADKMPGHWLLAKLGKRVLRPGGLELTRQLLNDLGIDRSDDVIEFAPGLGVTARLTLAHKPRSYTAIERDTAAARTVVNCLSGKSQKCIVATAEDTGLPSETASVVYGEAMLSMQPAAAKARIVAEAARLLKPGGRYGIHELCLMPDDVDPGTREAIQRGMSSEIHVGVRPLTAQEWREIIASAGLIVVAERKAPMHLLEPVRLIRDEGFPRAIRFIWNVIRDPIARRRVGKMRRVFRTYRDNLSAIALIATKPREQHP